MRFNLTNLSYDWPSSYETYFEFLQYAHGVVDNVLGVSLLVMIFLVLYGALSKWRTSVAFMTSSFVCLIVSVILWTQSLVGEVTVWTTLLLMIGSLAYKVLEG